MHEPEQDQPTGPPADGQTPPQSVGDIGTIPVSNPLPESLAPGGLPFVPGYTTEAVLGRGGMGVVYRARHLKLNRTAALKMILSGGHAGPAELARFRAEAEAVARLSHPGIGQVFEAGEHNGLPWCALEFCPNGSLADRLKAGPLPPGDAARLVRQLAQAVQHAHAHNIVHRDLKPANVLVAEDGSPKVTDFGLAKQLDGDAGETRTGAMMGTPAYMAPEQWTDARRAGPAADIWALGVILYESLTGKRPFAADTTAGIMARVVGDEPRPLDDAVPADLKTICRKCLEKEPARRFASAEALAEELRRYLDGEPLTIRPVSRRERAVKWVRRNPLVTGLVVAVCLALLGGSTLATGFGLHAAEQARLARLAEHAATEREKAERKAKEEATAARKEAVEEKERAEEEKVRADEQLVRAESARYAIQIDLAHWVWEQKDFTRMGELLDATRADVRGWEYHHLRGRERRTALALRGHAGAVWSAAFAPDGTRIVTGSADKSARIWDARTGREMLALKGYSFEVAAVAFAPDGKSIATGCLDGVTRIRDARTGQESVTLQAETGSVIAVAFSPDGKRVVTGSRDNTVRLWDARTGQEILSLKGHSDAVTAVAFSPDGKRILTGSGDRLTRVWVARSGEEVGPEAGPREAGKPAGNP